jgi:hypothetical protein
MKTITIITTAMLIVSIAACKKPNEQVATLPTEDQVEQTHNGNTFMTILSETMEIDGIIPKKMPIATTLN